MNMNGMIRFFARKVLNRGISAGIDTYYGGSKDRKDMTPEERAQYQAGKQSAKRNKQALKMMRRFGRF